MQSQIFPKLYNTILNRRKLLYCTKKPEKKPILSAGYWKDKTNQKNFLQEINKNLKDHNEWYNFKWKDFKENGGLGLISEYDNSLFDILNYHYPNINWNPFQFVWKPKGFWDKKANQRLFFDKISEKYKIEKQEDWKQIGYNIVRKEGGHGLLKKYSSFVDALQEIYPEKQWDVTKSRKMPPKGYWKSLDVQRKQLDKFKEEKGIKNHSDWKNLSVKEFIAFEGGIGILNQYSSYYEMLQTIYPKEDWNIFQDVKKVSRNYWKSKENQKKFLDQLAIELNINSLDDWLMMDNKKFGEKGNYLIKKYGSLHKLLNSLYPEYNKIVDFDNIRIPAHYFDDVKNQRYFLDILGNRKFQIKKLDDWNKISRTKIQNLNGGVNLLSRYSSTFEMFKTIYPEHNWKEEDRIFISRYYWNKEENVRQFFDQLKEKFNINEQNDWINISHQQIIDEGGGRILKKYSSLPNILKTIYPDENWDQINLRTRLPNQYWDDMGNIKNFLTSIENKFDITNQDDWARISIEQFVQSGGRTLLSKYGSLYSILKLVFPDKKWNKAKFQSRQKRSSQRHMFICIKKLFPHVEVVEEYLHQELSRISGRSIEIDTFIPKLNIGFEYQGKHHYEDSPMIGSLDMYQQRDTEKYSLCKEYNISLILIPYWWDGYEESLKEFIKQVIPDINFINKH